MVVNAYHPRVVGQAAAGAGEVRIERRGVLVPLVDIPASRVSLPDLYQLTPYGAAAAVQDPAPDEDAFSDRLARAADGQVRLQHVDITGAEDGREQLAVLGIDPPEVPDRVTPDGTAVRREVQSRLGLAERRAGVDLRDLLADDTLAYQAGFDGRNAHACNVEAAGQPGRH